MRLRNWSHHAARRSRQRAVASATVELVLDYGIEIPQRGGRTAWFLGKRQAARAPLTPAQAARVAGTAVITAADWTIVSVIRTGSTQRLRRNVGPRRGRRRP